jgi:homoserine O-acetyltransferase
MQALQWALSYPDELRRAIVIAGAARLTAQNIAFNDIARQAIMRDPDFHGGDYLARDATPKRGLGVARMLGHVTYLSDDLMAAKFGRGRRQDRPQNRAADDASRFGTEFEVESYLRYQGQKFSGAFDANTYLLMTRALDYFDPASACGGDLTAALAGVKAGFLVASFTSDWRFPPPRSREIVKSLLANGADVSYAEIPSAAGHDSFLLPGERYHRIVAAYMKRLHRELQEEEKNKAAPSSSSQTPPQKEKEEEEKKQADGLSARRDFLHIAGWIGDGADVLDLGCADGDLLSYLQTARAARGVGVDIDDAHIAACVGRGINAVQADIENDLAVFFQDGRRFDVVVLSQTLQAVRAPAALLREMLRIGKRAIVSAPNFGYWPLRRQLFLGGTMPVSKYLPHQWHDTPNIRYCTIADFERFCRLHNFAILDRAYLREGEQIRRAANLRADLAIYLLGGKHGGD